MGDPLFKKKEYIIINPKSCLERAHANGLDSSASLIPALLIGIQGITPFSYHFGRNFSQ